MMLFRLILCHSLSEVAFSVLLTIVGFECEVSPLGSQLVVLFLRVGEHLGDRALLERVESLRMSLEV